MTDPQQQIDEIRSFLQASDMTLTDRLKELAQGYAEACQAANQRLRRCDEFLKKGLRSEAIHFAQAEPVLLDVVAVLDFPERASFEEILQYYGLPEPPRLQLDIAQALNEAYAAEQPLEELLRTHRRLALVRASLSARIRTMRQIAKLDAANPIWSDDLRVFEGARLREIQTEVAGPARDNAARLGVVAQELASPEWLTPPPKNLVDQVTAQADHLARGQAAGALKEVVGQLNEAMTAGDLPRGLALRDHYLRLLDQARLALDAPLVRLAERPLDWLARQEQLQARKLEFQNALAAVEDALDREDNPEEVTRLYYEASNLGRALPAKLEQRYRDYVTRTDRARRWREWMILLSIFFAGAVLLLAVVGYLWLRAQLAAAGS